MTWLQSIHTADGPLPDGDYAMWFPSADEPTFTGSETRRSLDRAYEAVSGVETYVFAALLRQLGLVGEQATRVAFPDELATFAVAGPEGRMFVVSASREKGIRFHFDRASTPAAYRNATLRGFAEFADSMRNAVRLAGAPFDEPADEPPSRWWGFCEQVIAETERKGEPVEAVGKVLIG